MVDRDALAREMMIAFYQEPDPDIGISEYPDWENVADIAMRHIAIARVKALEEAAVYHDKTLASWLILNGEQKRIEDVEDWVRAIHQRSADRFRTFALAQSAAPGEKP